jgi:hypothetical protein
MSIFVVCPGCRKSFHVSDKFAGKTGPCPKCKAVIQVPEKAEEVKVHAPTQFAGGGRSTTGKLVTKPIARQSAKFQPAVAAIIAAAVLIVFALTLAGGKAGLFRGNLVACGLGLLLVSPPLVVAAYTFLRDEELEPYRGVLLYVRSAICGLVYALLWGGFGYLISRQVLTTELWTWALTVPFFLIGGLAALATLDLDFGSGLFHYAFYLLVTIVLRWAAGLGWIWQVASGPRM